MRRPYPERIPSYLQDVLDSAALLQSYLRPYTREDFASEDAPSIQLTLVRDSVVRRLEIIGQALHNIQTADSEYAKRHQLDVRAWYGLRSKISHGYEDLDYRLLWGAVKLDLPALVAQVRHCLDLDDPVVRVSRSSPSRGHGR
ncbi:MAG: HepT-like ribonuclease domain-containing protein [Comamonas sp.]